MTQSYCRYCFQEACTKQTCHPLNPLAYPKVVEALEWLLVDNTPEKKCGHADTISTCNCAQKKARAALAAAQESGT